jgi:hypothetical protein
MEKIKKFDEFTINKTLEKPIVDFSCLTVSDAEIEEWYENVRDNIDLSIHDHEYDYFSSNDILIEKKGDILPLDDFCGSIIEKYRFSKNQFVKKEYNNGIGIYTAIYKDPDIAESLDTDMRMHGFFLSKREIKSSVAYFFFEPLKQSNVNSLVFSKKCIYHYTPISNVDNILKNGLIPRNDCNPVYKYPPRVYFTLYENNGLANSLRKTLEENSMPTESHYMLLKINVVELKNDIDFYFDAFCANCVFTPNLILPEYISKHKEGYLLGGDKFRIIRTFEQYKR